MTDHAIDQSVQSNETKPSINSDSDNVELEFPQLLLEASLQSLLSHSHTSAANTVVNMSQPANPLSESWASISDIDYTQEDDLQSETTDTGSLIDASSVQDVYSVNESGDSSESEEDDDAEEEPQLIGSALQARVSASSAHDLQFAGSSAQLSTLLKDSTDTVLVDKYQALSDHVPSSFTDPDRQETYRPNQQGKSPLSSGVSSLSNSTSSLHLRDGPLRILLLKTHSVTADTQEAVLRKVGAALVSGDTVDMKSSNYHVIPSGFGPGAKPLTSELIPVMRQMTIYEGFHHPLRASSGELVLIDGSSVHCSPEGVLVMQTNGVEHQPDICLNIVGEHDVAETRQAVHNNIKSLAQSHLPVVTIEERDADSYPKALREANEGLIDQSTFGTLLACEAKPQPPIGLAQFLEFESMALNRYLSFLMENANHPSAASESFSPDVPVRARIVNWWAWLEGLAYQNAANMWQAAGCNTMLNRASQHPVFKHAQNLWSLVTPMRGAGIVILIVLISNIIISGTTYWMDRSIKTIDATAAYPYCRGLPVASTTAVSSTSTSSKDAQATALSKKTDVSLLSGMLHEVAEYWPLHRLAYQSETHDAHNPSSRPANNEGRECGVSAPFAAIRRGRTLEIPDTFYHEGQAAFTAVVFRETRAVDFILEDLGHGRRSIKIDGGEVQGLLKVLLSTPKPSVSRFCVHIDLRNTSVERFAGIIDQTYKKSRETERQPILWTLLRIQPEPSRRWPVIHQASQLAASTVETAHTFFEDTIMSQLVACYHNSNACWLRKAQKYESQFVAAAQEYEGRILASARMVCHRAATLANGVATRASHTLKLMSDSKPRIKHAAANLRISQNQWKDGLAKKAAKAQGRARRLLQAQHRR